MGKRTTRIAAVLALTLLVCGATAWRLDLIVPWYDHFFEEPAAVPTSPAQVEAPVPLDLPPVPAAPSVAEPASTSGGRVRPASVEAALAPHLADPALGPRILAAVADLDSGRMLARLGPESATPASLTKLLTGLAALRALGPERTFETRVVAAGKGRIVLVGGGDPYLMRKPADPDDHVYPDRPDVETLARDTAAALRAEGRRAVRLGYDDSLFTGPSFNPAWPASYAEEDVISPISALWVDGGRVAGTFQRVADPSLVAAQTFAAALAVEGIRVRGVPERGVASAGRLLASTTSPPVRQIVQRLIEVSDNEAAEVLLRHVGLQVMGEGSFIAGVSGVVATLSGLGIETSGVQIYDGSGLSRQNLIAPEALLAVLRTAALGDADVRLLLPGLAVAGFTGSLTSRFDDAFPEARGLVRAKTGTLTGVSSLAGIAVDQQGHRLLFVLMADRIQKVDEDDAQDALDRAAGALGACACGRIGS